MTLAQALDRCMVVGPLDDGLSLFAVRCIAVEKHHCTYELVRHGDKNSFCFGMSAQAEVERTRSWLNSCLTRRNLWHDRPDEGFTDWRVCTAEQLVRWTKEQLGDQQ